MVKLKLKKFDETRIRKNTKILWHEYKENDESDAIFKIKIRNSAQSTETKELYCSVKLVQLEDI